MSFWLHKWVRQHWVHWASFDCHRRSDHWKAPCEDTFSIHSAPSRRMTNFIFLTMIPKCFASVRRASRKSWIARLLRKIVQSPNPTALSKYSAAFIGCTIGYAELDVMFDTSTIASGPGCSGAVALSNSEVSCGIYSALKMWERLGQRMINRYCCK